MANELTKASLDGKSTKVAIGSPVITNDIRKNSKSIQQLMSGPAPTAPTLESFQALGVEGKQLGRGSGNDSISLDPQETSNADASVQWMFDDNSGTLSFVRRSGEVVSISGFLRQIDFGVGPTGPRGDPGRDGRDGRDGKDGKDGPTGCGGPAGLEGRQGEQGADGEEGPVGPTGLAGPPGPTGPAGVTGPQGLHGMEGRRGPKGFSCDTSLVGPTGATGRTMNSVAGMGSSPGATDLIWAAAEDCLCFFDPSVGNFSSIPAPTIVSSSRVKAPSQFCPSGHTINGVWQGITEIKGTMLATLYSNGEIIYSDYQYEYSLASCSPQVYRETYTHTGTGYSLNMEKCFKYPTIPGVYTFINDGVIGGSAGAPALRTGSFPSGSTLIFINNGKVVGIGGSSSYFYSYSFTPVAAGAGGDGLWVEYPMSIQNYGRIAGGGGGGGASAEWGGKNNYHVAGGGGAGIPGGAGNLGGWSASYPGSELTPGIPWAAYLSNRGGEQGEPGQNATIRLSNDYQVLSNGAAAGRAIVGTSKLTSAVGGTIVGSTVS